jgi:hypothetical protein
MHRELLKKAQVICGKEKPEIENEFIVGQPKHEEPSLH